MYRFHPPDKRRPVLIMTRGEALDFLNTATVAPISSSTRGSPAEVLVGTVEGLRHASAVNLDHVQTVPKRDLERFVGRVGEEKMAEICRALAVAIGCDPSAHNPGGRA
jgi:mRNA interferase MazF